MNKATLIMVAFALLLIPASVEAQHAGFITGIAPGFVGPAISPGFTQPAVQPFSAIGHVPFGFPATQVPVIVTHPTTFVTPGFVTPFLDPFIHQQLHILGTPHIHVIPHNFHQVFVPGGFIAPGGFQVQAEVLSPGFVRHPAAGPFFGGHQVVFGTGSVPGQAQVVRPGPVASPTGPPSMAGGQVTAGMPRAGVISTLGSPNVTVFSAGKETLFFSNGLTVVLENGRVANIR